MRRERVVLESLEVIERRVHPHEPLAVAGADALTAAEQERRESDHNRRHRGDELREVKDRRPFIVMLEAVATHVVEQGCGVSERNARSTHTPPRFSPMRSDRS